MLHEAIRLQLPNIIPKLLPDDRHHLTGGK